MSSYSKRLLLALTFILLISESAFAINITALYLSGCKRELGVITGVDGYNVQMIQLDGKVINVPRYEIIYLTSYPLDILPIKKISGAKELKLIDVKTLDDNQIVDLIRGWPIDFSDTKISFLTPSGSEAAVDRDSIWELKVENASDEVAFKNQINFKYEFVHPHAFDYCEAKPEGNLSSAGKTQHIYPQQILSDPIIIKKELDRLMKGHEVVQNYLREQRFYPVPQIYGNVTSLGLWVSAGSRYGVSSSRTNYTPILTDEFSSGPFGYQRLFLTGSAPMPYSVHEEPQTQIYYKFKADYFHMSAMLDPNIVLVGSKYQWARQDLSGTADDRASESAYLDFGFDYGAFAINFAVTGLLNVGVADGSTFVYGTGNLPRGGFIYYNHFFKTDFQFGSAGFDAFKYNFFRANAEILFVKNFNFMYSFIYKNMTFNDSTKFQYTSTGITNALYVTYHYNYRLTFSAFGGLEAFNNQFGVTSLATSSSNVYPKGGVNGSLSF